MEVKKCCHCKKAKCIKEFYKNRSTKDGFSCECKECRKREYEVCKRNRRERGFTGESAIGYKYEKLALKLLPGSIHISDNNFKNLDYDLLWKGKTIDVKMRNVAYDYRNSKYTRWIFRLTLKADYYFLFCCDRGKVKKRLLIPSSKLSKCPAVGVVSKFDVYSV